jgi:hypothetical protein
MRIQTRHDAIGKREVGRSSSCAINCNCQYIREALCETALSVGNCDPSAPL